jgi:hypothetical protein
MMRLCLIVLAVLAIAPAAEAQPGIGPGPGARRERIKERIMALRAQVLTEELQLDASTSGKLFPVLARHDAELQRLGREAANLRREADEAVARRDGTAINRAIDGLLANQQRRWAVETARFQEARPLLTPAQAARLLVVLPAIERRIHRQMRRALDGPPGMRRRGVGDRPAQGGMR